MILFAKSMKKLEKETNTNLFDIETNASVRYHEEFVKSGVC